MTTKRTLLLALLRILLPSWAAVGALLVVLSCARSPLSDYDVLFNLASGRYLLTQGFPAQDPFSETAEAAWFPHEWGFDVAVSLATERFGGLGPALLAALVLAAGMLLFWRLLRKADPGALWTLALFLLAQGAQSFTWETQRAYQLGDLLFLIAWGLLLKVRKAPARGKLTLLGFLPLTALWANLHGSWPVAPALLSACALGLLLEDRQRRAQALWMGAAALGAFCAAALSPRGFATCLYPLRFLASGGGEQIHEWGALDLAAPEAKALLGLLLVFGFALGRAPRRPWAAVLPTLGLAAAAVWSKRHAPMAAVLLALTTAELLAGSPRLELPRWLRAAVDWLQRPLAVYQTRAGGAIWPALVLVGFGAAAWSSPVPLLERLDRRAFPVEAITALQGLPPGRVLNHWALGGAVSVFCGPACKVYIDGRNDLFPARIHADYRRLVLQEPGWERVVEGYAPAYILWARFNLGGPFLEAMRRQVGWRVVAEDDVGALLARSEPGAN